MSYSSCITETSTKMPRHFIVLHCKLDRSTSFHRVILRLSAETVWQTLCGVYYRRRFFAEESLGAGHWNLKGPCLRRILILFSYIQYSFRRTSTITIIKNGVFHKMPHAEKQHDHVLRFLLGMDADQKRSTLRKSDIYFTKSYWVDVQRKKILVKTFSDRFLLSLKSCF